MFDRRLSGSHGVEEFGGNIEVERIGQPYHGVAHGLGMVGAQQLGGRREGKLARLGLLKMPSMASKRRMRNSASSLVLVLLASSATDLEPVPIRSAILSSAAYPQSGAWNKRGSELKQQ